jgi:hypothetical protein
MNHDRAHAGHCRTLGVMKAFAEAATGGRRARAEALLDDEVRADPWGRLILGLGWEGDASEPGGPLNWAPLLYASFSCFANADVLRTLLARGADPNVTFTNEHGAMPALYGAAGVAHDAERTRVLLEAGAEPNDGESLYHATESEDPACLRALLEHGGKPEPIVLAHALDDERMEIVQVLLEAGVDARELLPHAVRRGRGPEYLRLLVAHGADLEHRGGETWRGNVPLRTAYQHAVLRGRDESAATLAELGADTTVDPDDRAVAALERVPAEMDVDRQEAVILAMLHGHADRVIEVFGVNFRGVVGGSPEGSLLQHASWVGSPELVRTLLAAGAEVEPLHWAVHGSENYGGGDYVAIAEQLVAAGAVIEPEFAEQAGGPLAEWLRARLPR